jgi:hypothetical protein
MSKFAALWDTLTPHERRVISMRCRGKSRKEICADMSISEVSVRNHITNANTKLREGLGFPETRRGQLDMAVVCWRYGYEVGVRHERIRQSDDPPADDGVH